MGVFDAFRQGANRAAFEADKRLRLGRAEANTSALRRTMSAQIAQLGEAAYALHKQQGLGDATLTSLAELVLSTEQQVEVAEAEAAKIRLESAPARAVQPAQPVPVVPVPPVAGRVCLRCQVNLPAEATFCPNCGSPASDAEPLATSQAAEVACAACGKPMPREARFCPECGAPGRQASPPSA